MPIIQGFSGIQGIFRGFWENEASRGRGIAIRKHYNNWNN